MKEHAVLPEHFKYIPDILDNRTARKLFNTLYKTAPWKNERLKMFGKEVITKRMSVLYGDEGLEYSYAGERKIAVRWTPELLKIKTIVEKVSGTAFNVCLINKYENGTEGMGWHSDNEPELGLQPTITSVSLGAHRRFDIRDRNTGSTWHVMLEQGSLLLMSGDSQTRYKHQVPQSRTVTGARINLTFRYIEL